ncbi:hypothetical protein TSOC_004756 [Tetrabaena socialis]|uniref:Tyr recombinase domain-containing protein n=1 Tax=Tetrabaena socialis TaxID=47790 RepID=A0A2J8A865_9CHLO|nr:hypothetical protein TSOC_004756 [Tetrabaena socialis]|eukprot:PNH08663.1 hypothetical protein TSOC_004756 [Tetrabaena socialis]
MCYTGLLRFDDLSRAPHCLRKVLVKHLVRCGYKVYPAQAAVDGCRVDDEDLGVLMRSYVLARVSELFLEAGMDKRIGLHAFRVAWATKAVNAGTERVVVQKLGRWMPPATFEKHYVKHSVPM